VPTKKTNAPPDIYQIKVTLLGTKPPIWRRLLVPARFTLEDLHGVLQAAMGWGDGHLHEFKIDGKLFGQPDMDDMGLPPVASERKARLFSVLGGAGAKAVYTYDFGDDWEHAIVVEKVLAPDPNLRYPLCTGGKRRGPPEDCGGVPGFYNLLEALADPGHQEHDEMLEWVGGPFDPEDFSVEEINSRLEP